MEDLIYQELRQQLDRYAVGFPVSPSGKELEILKRLFTADEAQLYRSLSLKPEPADAIATRSGRDSGSVTDLLESMFKKGLVFRREKDGTVKFGALPFAPGIFEQQSETMDKTLAALYEVYFQEVYHKNVAETNPHLIHRPIPINRSIVVSYPMAVYDNSREIDKNQELIAVAKCICRVQKEAIHEGCQMPLETCFMFGSQAQYYMDRGTGREVSVDEALEILDRCEEAGLVTMPFNTMTPANICNCCSDCCIVLGTLKKHPRPVEMIKPGFHAIVEQDRCEGCETCVGRCPMDAVVMGAGDKAEIDLDRCIGCGLCINVCPEEAIHLEPKPEKDRVVPPKTGAHTFMEIVKRRQESSASRM
ncbi:MAG: 4Fe-4S binding protein [Deltaproteobacteria bacterium]|nr:4Fe-4S binding protein [Deltaproteobacteria bacterium]